MSQPQRSFRGRVPGRRSSKTVAIVIVFAGVSTSGQGQEERWAWVGDGKNAGAADDCFGCSVSWLGDVDGDGVVDVVVGAQGEDIVGTMAPGAVYVKSGGTGATLYKVTGTEAFELFGMSVAGGSDYDGDGVADFVVGAPQHDGGVLDRGAAFVYSGATGVVLYSLAGENAVDYFGVAVGTLDDLDGDGVDEFGVGAPAYVLGGRAYVYSGMTGSLIYTITGSMPGQGLALMRQLDDLNGDGIGEIGVGSPRGGPNSEGQVDIVDGPSGSILYTLVGEATNDYFGAFISGLGDMDGDGVGDLVVAAPGKSFRKTGEGRVYVYSGASLTLLYFYDGARKDDHLGQLPTVGNLDFNADGFADVMVGNPLAGSWGAERDTTIVYSGRTGRLLFGFRGADFSGTADSRGASLSAVGDMNRDGIDDVVLGAAGPDPGWAYVHLGNDLFLQADKQDYAAGDAITIQARGGIPGELALIAVTAVDGAPKFLTIMLGVLDSNAELEIAETVPAGLSGLEVTFMAWATKPGTRKLADSMAETIAFQ